MHKTLLIASLALSPAALTAQEEQSEYDRLVAAFAEATAKYHAPGEKIAPLLPAILPHHEQFRAAAMQRKGEAALPFLGWLLQNAPRNPDAHGFAVKALDAMAAAKAKALRDDPERAKASRDRYKASRKAVQHLKYNKTTDAAFAQTLLEAKVLALAAADEETRQASARSVFKLQRLREGMVAPDIAGEDLDGNAFKLSDYRGKVVVIDFWGDW